MKILYITFGEPKFHLQARLSILSAQNYCAAEHIAVITDRPDEFANLGVEILPVMQAKLTQFLGPMNYNFRVKVAGILQYHRQNGGAFIYVDSDTYWLRNPLELAESLTGKTCLMEKVEGVISPEFHNRLNRFLTARREALERAGYNFAHRQRTMCCAGLIGLPVLADREELLQSVLEFTDYMTLHFPQQPEWVEQFAFSSILAERQGLNTAEGFTNHYWGCNWEVQILLGRLANSDFIELARSPEAFSRLLASARRLQQDPSHQRYLRTRKLKRLVQKRMGTLRAFFLRTFSRPCRN